MISSSTFKKTFQDRPVPLKSTISGEEAIPTLRKQCPNVFGYFARNTNGNLVVLEAKIKNNRIVDIEQYWLDIDPVYRQRARSKAKMHDREELNIMERHFYGFSYRLSSDGKRATVHMNQLPSKPVILVIDSHGILKSYVKINQKVCVLDHVFIHYESPSLLKPLGCVPLLKLYGTDPETERSVCERMVR